MLKVSKIENQYVKLTLKTQLWQIVKIVSIYR